MEANHEYVLQKCRELGGTGHILDYGCGGGAVVEAGRARGLDIRGVDAFYAGAADRQIVERKGLLGSVIVPLRDDGRMPFDDGSFSLVVANQVFEHVDDLDQVLSEIFRVLEPGGHVLTLFPSREIWREMHCGVPFAHWFEKRGACRYPYIRLMRGLGLGNYTQGKTHAEWARQAMVWLDRFTTYRGCAEVMRSFATLTPSIGAVEPDYIDFRLRRTRLAWTATILRNRPGRRIARLLCRKLAGMVLVARKQPVA